VKDPKSGRFIASVLTAFILVSLWAPATAAPADASTPELFALALKHYDENKTSDALWIFKRLTESTTRKSEWHAPSRLMLARCLYRADDLPGARGSLADLLVIPVGERLSDRVITQRKEYLPYARYLQGMIAWRQRDFRETVDFCYQVATDPVVSMGLTEEARYLARAAVYQADSAVFSGMTGPVRTFVDEILQLNRATRLYYGGQWLASRMTAQALERTSPESIYGREISTLISQVRRAETSEVRIAVIAPLGGRDSSAGAELLNGVKFALSQQRSPLISQLVVRDVRDQIDAIKAVQDLASDLSIRAIIGPLTTDNSIAAAAVANSLGIPLVAPTATGSRLADIGPYVFQVNTPPAAQGRILASVAIDSLKAMTVATLSSFDPDDRAMADEFARTVVEKGGEVMVQEWFAPGSVDLRPQLRLIRREGLVRDTTIAEETRLALKEARWTELDTMQIMREVNTIDVLLVCSGDDRDLVNLAAQIPTQKIWARILGGTGWGSRNLRRKAGENAEGVVFATRNDIWAPATRRFVDAYRMDRHDEPSAINMLSYDATSLVIKTIVLGAKTRMQVRDGIAATANWHGASGIITLGADGGNTQAFVRTLRGGMIQRVPDWSKLMIPRYWGASAILKEVPEEEGTETTIETE
jgi:branched-chain amino acid transport system substrate-binding protein